MVWYSHLFQNFPQFIVIHTVKGFGIASKAEVDFWGGLSCFFDDAADVGNLIYGSSVFSKSSLMVYPVATSMKICSSSDGGVHPLLCSQLGVASNTMNYRLQNRRKAGAVRRVPYLSAFSLYCCRHHAVAKSRLTVCDGTGGRPQAMHLWDSPGRNTRVAISFSIGLYKQSKIYRDPFVIDCSGNEINVKIK